MPVQCFTTGSKYLATPIVQPAPLRRTHPRRLADWHDHCAVDTQQAISQRAVADWLGRLALARKHSWVIGDPRIGLRGLPLSKQQYPCQPALARTCSTQPGVHFPVQARSRQVAPRSPNLHPHQHSGTHNQKIPHSSPLPFLVAHLSSTLEFQEQNKHSSKSEYANDDDNIEATTSSIDRPVRNVCHLLLEAIDKAARKG